MKKLTSLLIGCSLALAGAALAQQPVESQPQAKGKRAPEKAHEAQPQPQPGRNAPKPQERPQQTGAMKQQHGATNQAGAMNQPAAEKGPNTHKGHEAGNVRDANAPTKSTGQTTNEPGAAKGQKGHVHEQSANAPATGTNVSGREPEASKQHGKQQAEEHKKGMKQPAAAAKTSPAAAGTNAAGPNAAAPGSAGAGVQQNAQANAGAKMKKPAPEQVQQVKTQRANFKAQPKPQQVQPVTFNQNHRIEGSEHWQGQQYEVFRSYQPQWHDAGWYNSHYGNVALIAGGYYFFNQGYWYPAWGYNPSAQYYAYDGPIYAGQRAVPPDQVIAQTQDLLQQMGYYKGEVDGLLGPLTREALTAYQTENGLAPTAAIDQPTLDSLGLA